MAGLSAPSPSRGPTLRRDADRRVVGGVCAGIAGELGVDPLVVRVAFLAAAAAGGVGIAVYALAWVLTPSAAGSAAPVRRLRTGRGEVEVALGVGFLVLATLLALRAAGIWFSDVVVWPLVLVASGGALLWRQSQTSIPAEPGRRAGAVSRTGLGVALVVAAGVVFLSVAGVLGAARDALLATLVAAVVLAVIFAPWVVRLARTLGAERAERIRSQERAEMAAHLHDSVLQTLALVQKRAGDSREVASLARRQERELRAWLSGRPAAGDARGLAAGLDEAATDVEREHGTTVDVVAVGDVALDERGEALVAAAREAMVNAAKFGGGSDVDVYAEVGPERVEVFVRDRGPGFDPGSVPPDRRGLRESIVGRMARHGGRAQVRGAPGQGTEVELVLERSP